VGTAIAIKSARASGVVNVATLPRARGHGVGSALTWAAAAVGGAWGRDTIVLQASPMGLPIYSAMGFRTVVKYTEYGNPSPLKRAM
jgi:GNAT superfamily N-acetyltransferase